MAWQKEFLTAALGAIVGATATLGVAYFGFLNKNRELDIKMIEIALGILREDPSLNTFTSMESSTRYQRA